MQENSDIAISVILFFGGIAIIFLSYLNNLGQYGLGFAFLGAPIAYALIRKSPEFNGFYNPVVHFQISGRGKKIISIVLYIINILVIIMLYSTDYFRSSYYFILVSIAFTILIIQALFTSSSVKAVLPYFFNLFLVSLSFRAGRFFLFPTIPGSDIHAHILIAKYITDFGRIAPYAIADKYSSTPFWHIYQAFLEMVTNLNAASSLFILASVSIISLSLMTYIISTYQFSFRIGLIAAVFVNIGDMIFVGTLSNINTSILVLVFFLVLITCLYHKNKFFFGIAYLMVITMFWTHQLGVFVVFLIVASIFLYYIFSQNNILRRFFPLIFPQDRFINRSYINMYFMIFITTYMIFFWSSIGDESNKSSFFGNMISRLTGTATEMVSEYVYPTELTTTVYEKLFSTFDIIDSILYNFGYALIFCLALVGGILILKQYLTVERGAILFSILTLFVIIYPGTYIGLDLLLLPHRFLPFFQILFIISSSVALVELYKSTSEKTLHILLSLSVLVMVFFLITAPYTNRNDPVYAKGIEPRTELMHSELAGISWGQKTTSDHSVSVDPLIEKRQLSTVEIVWLDPENITYYDKKDQRSLIYLRSYIEKNPNIKISGTFGKRRLDNYSSFLGIICSNKSMVYTNDNVKIYLN